MKKGKCETVKYMVKSRAHQVLDRPEEGESIPHSSIRDIVPLMKTGDLIIQIGDGGLSDRFNRYLQWSMFTHVLMIIKDPPDDLVQAHAKAMASYEKQRAIGPQTIDTKGLYGFEVQPGGVLFRPFWMYVAEKELISCTRKEDYPFIWRPLENPAVPEDGSMKHYPKLLPLLWDCVGKPYEKKPMQFVKGWMYQSSTDDHSSVFCSELTAWALKEMGLIGDKSITSNFMPGDFSDQRGDEINKLLAQGPIPNAKYGPLVNVDYQAEKFGLSFQPLRKILGGHKYTNESQ
mmetsp:Transcript_90827/g.157533  ORF Transcript_90827/g.157533 Transcript_90827/m.157533 type:complete len:289 (-) Transcript_90827:844-1710(-)